MSKKLLGLLILSLTQMIFASARSGKATICRPDISICESFRFIAWSAGDNGTYFRLKPTDGWTFYSKNWIIKVIED